MAGITEKQFLKRLKKINPATADGVNDVVASFLKWTPGLDPKPLIAMAEKIKARLVASGDLMDGKLLSYSLKPHKSKTAKLTARIRKLALWSKLLAAEKPGNAKQTIDAALKKNLEARIAKLEDQIKPKKQE